MLNFLYSKTKGIKLSNPYPPIIRFVCPHCGDGKTRDAQNTRIHIRNYHPEISEVEYERYIVGCRYPTIDIEWLVQRYVDRLETMVGLQRKGIFVKKYLQTIGVARDWRADLSLMGILKRYPDVQTAEDVRAAYEHDLIGKFRKASPEQRFQGYLNRENSKLEKSGQAELIETISTLKTIKFVKQRLQEVVAERDEESETEANPE